jgi:hypothetical protein
MIWSHSSLVDCFVEGILGEILFGQFPERDEGWIGFGNQFAQA